MADRPIIAYIGVGSNIEPEMHIARALELLKGAARVTACSTFYRTPAIGRPEQPDYLNGVWRIETAASPRELKFDILRGIEDRLGRVRGTDRYAPRTIDLDVLLCGGAVVNDPDCRVPAPELRNRPFMVECLLELDPQLVLPDTGEPLASLLEGATEGTPKHTTPGGGTQLGRGTELGGGGQDTQRPTLEAAEEFTRRLRSSLDPLWPRPGRD